MKITRSRTLASVLALAGLVPACNKDEDLSGTYVGVAQLTAGALSGQFEVRATLSHSGSSLSGSYTSRQIAPLQAPSGSGTLSGTVTGNSVTLDFMPSSPLECPARFDGRSGNRRLTGTVTLLGACAGIGAPLELVKQ
jgi:hypothetical protein